MEWSPPFGNRLIQVMQKADLNLLHADLERIECTKGYVFVEPFRPIKHVYFLEGGLASMVEFDSCGRATEIGMRGYEGLVGATAILGTDHIPHKVHMQAGGTVVRMRTKALREAMDRSASLRSLLLRYAYVIFLQATHTAYANARFRLDERLARWLLMAADRLGPQLPFTHESLSSTLGVRRSGVTETLHILEGEKLIIAARCHIIVRNRTGLEAHAGSAYGTPEREYARLIGPLRYGQEHAF